MSDMADDECNGAANGADCLARDVPLSEICEPPPRCEMPPGVSVPCKFHKTPQFLKELENKVFALFEQSIHFYKPQEFMLAFNGGKDCTVLLHLLLRFYASSAALKHLSLPVLYIESEDVFDEVNQFVDYCTFSLHIDMWRAKGSIKDALFDFCGKNPHIKAIFMGSRRTDPYCKEMREMQPTDADYPPLMRINPLLDWTYSDIWAYIFVNGVPYCSLYDEGYTSLGAKSKTHKNPKLRVVSRDSPVDTYKPAYQLEEDDEGSCERVGRN